MNTPTIELQCLRESPNQALQGTAQDLPKQKRKFWAVPELGRWVDANAAAAGSRSATT